MSTYTTIADQITAKHSAILGKTGSGKTWAAKGLVERLLSRGQQVCVVDPTSAWWGMRLAADGKGRGHDVILLGGDHGDITLAPRSGDAVARLVTEQGASVIIDTGSFTVGDYTRWFIDFADWPLAAGNRWTFRKANRTAYAIRSKRTGKSATTQYLHRVILDAPKFIEVDHRDGNGLNCQRSNMRFASRAQQCQNQMSRRLGGIKGAHFMPEARHKNRPWRSLIHNNNKRISLGYFATEREAGMAYDRMAKHLFGEFAKLNFPVAS